jgi:hypothetical protein
MIVRLQHRADGWNLGRFVSEVTNEHICWPE